MHFLFWLSRFGVLLFYLLSKYACLYFCCFRSCKGHRGVSTMYSLFWLSRFGILLFYRPATCFLYLHLYMMLCCRAMFLPFYDSWYAV